MRLSVRDFRCLLVWLALLFGSFHATGQASMFFGSLDAFFYECHVKSLDEFIQRFNGHELYPLIENDSSNIIQTTRASLFDYDLIKDLSVADSVPSLYEQFIVSLGNDTTMISIESPENWIEVLCEFNWKAASVTLPLMMQLEEDADHNWRWAIIGVRGVEEQGLLGDGNVVQISPVEHELNFMGLSDIFSNNTSRISSTRKSGIVLDTLSYFYGLLASGKLKYIGCNGVEFHCNQVPGYSFTVKEINRLKSTNSGWLINSLSKTSETNEE